MMMEMDVVTRTRMGLGVDVGMWSSMYWRFKINLEMGHESERENEQRGTKREDVRDQWRHQ